MIAEPGTNVQPRFDEVQIEHLERWQSALQRGQSQRLSIRQDAVQVSEPNRDGNSTTTITFTVGSHSEPGLLHTTIIRTCAETVLVSCDCIARAIGHAPCTHAALALETAQLWPFPILSQTDMEIIADGPAVDEDGDDEAPSTTPRSWQHDLLVDALDHAEQLANETGAPHHAVKVAYFDGECMRAGWDVVPSIGLSAYDEDAVHYAYTRQPGRQWRKGRKARAA